jgi:hypothetical protein
MVLTRAEHTGKAVRVSRDMRVLEEHPDDGQRRQEPDQEMIPAAIFPDRVAVAAIFSDRRRHCARVTPLR